MSGIRPKGAIPNKGSKWIVFVCGAWGTCCDNCDDKRASDSKTEHGSDDDGTVGVWLNGAVDELI